MNSTSAEPRPLPGILAALAVAATFALPMAAQASVLYTWQTAALGGNITAVEGYIRFSDSFFPAGQPSSTIGCNGLPYMQGSVPTPAGPGCQTFAGIQDFYFRVNNSPVPLSFSSLRMVSTLGLDSSSALVGSIRAETNQTTDVELRSAPTGSLWTVIRYGSDAGPQSCFTGPLNCFGATGTWVLTPIPEPASWLLLGLGGLGLGAVVGWRRRQSVGS